MRFPHKRAAQRLTRWLETVIRTRARENACDGGEPIRSLRAKKWIVADRLTPSICIWRWEIIRFFARERRKNIPETNKRIRDIELYEEKFSRIESKWWNDNLFTLLISFFGIRFERLGGKIITLAFNTRVSKREGTRWINTSFRSNN